MLSAGQTLSSRYTIVRPLKEGGMGAIYEALDTRLNARVAIKENFFSEEYLRVSFRREAQLLANLSHPSLPRVIDYFFEGEGQYLVMDFIEGDDLASLIAQHKSFGADEVLDWARQLLDVLQYLQNQPTPIQHRDIKPSNLKVKEGRVILLDFGLAYGHSGEMSTMVSSQFNWDGRSPRYSPLEQLNCQPTTPASDLYSLGATLYELLTGRPPESCETRSGAIAQKRPDPLQDIRRERPDVDADVARAIMQSLALDVNKRPQSAREMHWLMFPPQITSPRITKRRTLGVRRFVSAVLLLMILPLAVIVGYAVSGLRTARCQDPSDSTVRRMLRCSGSNEALRLIPTSVISSDPAARLFSIEAEQLLQSAKYDAAISKTQEVLAVAPNYVYAQFIYGDALWDTKYNATNTPEEMPGVQEQADKILALVLAPRTWEEYAARAWANLAKGKPDFAIADASRALELNPECVSARMIRATARSKGTGTAAEAKQSLESLADYDEVIRLRPHYAQAWANRAGMYVAVGENRLAVSDYTEAIKLRPQPNFYIGLAEAYQGLKDYDSAIAAYREALNLDAKSFDASIGLADIYFEQADWSNAAKNYTASLKIQETAYVYNKRAYAFNELRKFDRSVPDLNAAIRLDPTDYRSYYMRAYAYSQLTRWEDAIIDYTETLERAPKEELGTIYRSRAEAYRQIGEDRLARSDEKRAQDLGD
jgi:serine/threonine protein kinase/Tfp pilus assembly protein PilF